jgi:hypothetical protein
MKKFRAKKQKSFGKGYKKPFSSRTIDQGDLKAGKMRCLEDPVTQPQNKTSFFDDNPRCRSSVMEVFKFPGNREKTSGSAVFDFVKKERMIIELQYFE